MSNPSLRRVLSRNQRALCAVGLALLLLYVLSFVARHSSSGDTEKYIDAYVGGGERDGAGGEDSAESDSPGADALRRLCLLRSSQLSSLVWSHRASFPYPTHAPTTFHSVTIPTVPTAPTLAADGSPSALLRLLHHGIRRFDVDVLCIPYAPDTTHTTNPPTPRCRYLVTHPSAVAGAAGSASASVSSAPTPAPLTPPTPPAPPTPTLPSDQPQSVSDFLQQIYDHCQEYDKYENPAPAAAGASASTPTPPTPNYPPHPLISLEMKFAPPQQRAALIRQVQLSPMSQYVVFIATDPSSLRDFLPLESGGVAAAYRSRPLTGGDYTWPGPSGGRGGGGGSNSDRGSGGV
eukprot:CAMPEP_0173333016 /NCGR_PEP_ID=MMETSP1144-20121109/4653_1 /TAXON_ID=483371 /ORGANISM="non described non described, Strain CCMP2298" /LENGTH=347 /DNA_ID=CAMNT_0014277923 /DNA_START=42 /DNA_END=1082 /DNA_ORIENTATION=+